MNIEPTALGMVILLATLFGMVLGVSLTRPRR
jgi:hypothetical protein